VNDREAKLEIEVLPGRRSPLGATWDGEGVNFAVFSENATAVELCLFDADDPTVETARARLREVTAHVWHGYVLGLKPGQLYGYRVDGPYQPEQGLRFNPFKLLLDPYAKAVAGKVDWSQPVFAYPLGSPAQDLEMDERDSAAGMPKGVVLDTDYDWEGDRPLRTPWHRTVIYEAHVKGLTARHPDVPPELRGTYAGVAHPAIIQHLQSIGVTALELLPVHDFVDDNRLLEMGLRNYWGYNTLNFFSPDARYSGNGDRGGQVNEFRDMVKTLHRAGIEVILDVVYNHTAEGNHLGPSLSFKGIDNPTYYRLVDDKPRFYMDHTGTGHSLDTRHPQVLKLVNDSLRYWVQEMHVDGFRFDLAATLAREGHGMSRLSSFFDVIHQDPVLSEVKLIAEPWDIGEYQVGNFPVLWTEWNGKYRDDVRSYWRGDPGTVNELAYRLTGSSDLYGDDGRKAYASINFVTAHDGFTLNDLATYNEKHNEANGENNTDGESHNRSHNFGVEGPSDDPGITYQREKQRRNLLATLLLSQGVPMILGGDEMGRTQQGNNNAYCQDNEISWFDWELDDSRRDLLEFTRQVAALRRDHPIFRRRKFFQGQKIRGSELEDIRWVRPDGQEMDDDDWETHFVRSFGMLLGGDAMMEWDDRGNRVYDDTFLLLFNGADDSVAFTLPATPRPAHWEPVLDTARRASEQESATHAPGATVELAGRSMLVLRRVSEDGDRPAVTGESAGADKTTAESY
jgi:isoamylase